MISLLQPFRVKNSYRINCFHRKWSKIRMRSLFIHLTLLSYMIRVWSYSRILREAKKMSWAPMDKRTALRHHRIGFLTILRLIQFIRSMSHRIILQIKWRNWELWRNIPYKIVFSQRIARTSNYSLKIIWVLMIIYKNLISSRKEIAFQKHLIDNLIEKSWLVKPKKVKPRWHFRPRQISPWDKVCRAWELWREKSYFPKMFSCLISRR